MGTEFWWFYDAVLVMIILYTIYSCAKRGGRRILILICGYIIAVLLGSAGSAFLTDPIYSSSVKDSEVHKLEQILKTYDPAQALAKTLDRQDFSTTFDAQEIAAIFQDEEDIPAALTRYVNKESGYDAVTQEKMLTLAVESFRDSMRTEIDKQFPVYAEEAFSQTITEHPEYYVQTMQKLADPQTKSAAVYIEKTYLETATRRMISTFTFLVVFCFAMGTSAAISQRRRAKSDDTGYTTPMEHVVGGFMGLLAAFVRLCILALFLKLLFMLVLQDTMVLNEATIEHTKLFRLIYEIDFIQ